VFKQYALRSQLFAFSVTTALPISPTVWLLSWALLLGCLIFYIYWMLAWGIGTSDVTIYAWGINFAIATAQDILIIQVFRLYVIYVISNITIKPQLAAIYRTLQRLAIEYVQDELPDAFGVIKVVQHVSPACRVAKLKVSENLAAGQILRHIDDRDIRNFRHASKLSLPVLLLTVVAIPVLIGLASESAGEIGLDTVLPSVFSMLVVAHYMLWQISPVIVILPYSVLLVLLVTRPLALNKARKRMESMHQQREVRGEVWTLASWQRRTRNAHQREVASTASIVLIVRTLAHTTVASCADLCATVVFYSQYNELGALIGRAFFRTNLQSRHGEVWAKINLPAGLHGQRISPAAALQMETFSSESVTVTAAHVPSAIRAMHIDVRAQWDMSTPAEGSPETSCAGYLLNVLTCDYLSPTHPAQLPPHQADTDFGYVVSRGVPPSAPLFSAVATQFRDVFEHSTRPKPAITRTFASYRKQVLAGLNFCCVCADDHFSNNFHFRCISFQVRCAI